jgi:hypothetical protein
VENDPARPMTTKEKILYHQIHPAKLVADITASIVSGYMVWQHEVVAAIVVAFALAILASLLVLCFADLERLKDSRFGRYIDRFMDRPTEAWRFAGQIVMWVGAWYQRWWVIVLGALITASAWASGLWRVPRQQGFQEGARSNE